MTGVLFQILGKCLVIKIKDRFSSGKSVSKFTSTNWQSQEHFYKGLGRQNVIKITNIWLKFLSQNFKVHFEFLIEQSIWLFKKIIRFEGAFFTMAQWLLWIWIYIYYICFFSSIQVNSFYFMPLCPSDQELGTSSNLALPIFLLDYENKT